MPPKLTALDRKKRQTALLPEPTTTTVPWRRGHRGSPESVGRDAVRSKVSPDGTGAFSKGGADPIPLTPVTARKRRMRPLKV